MYFSVHTGHVIEDWRLDLVVVDKNRSCKITDFAVPGNSRIKEREQEKIKKYEDLQFWSYFGILPYFSKGPFTTSKTKLIASLADQLLHELPNDVRLRILRN